MKNSLQASILHQSTITPNITIALHQTLHETVMRMVDVIEAHGYGMRFRLMIVSIRVAKVQFVRRFERKGLRQQPTVLPDKHNWACPRTVGGLDDSLFLYLMELLGHLLTDCKWDASDGLWPQWCITSANVNLDGICLPSVSILQTEHIMKLLQE